MSKSFPSVMPDQIDPGTSIDVYDVDFAERDNGEEWVPCWTSGWVLVGCAFRCHDHDGDFWSYEVYRYPGQERSVPVTFVRRAKELSKV